MPKELNVTIQSCNNGYIVTDLNTNEQYIVTTFSRDYTDTSLVEVLRGIEDSKLAYLSPTNHQG